MTVQEQIDALKKQIASLEKQIELESTETPQIQHIRKLGNEKIDSLVHGYLEDGIHYSGPIDWELCDLIGQHAKDNWCKSDGYEYIWPYKDAKELADHSEKLLKDALNRCLDAAKGECDGAEYDDCVSYCTSVASGRFMCVCHVNVPKDPTAMNLDGCELVWFEAHVEMDGICEW